MLKPTLEQRYDSFIRKAEDAYEWLVDRWEDYMWDEMSWKAKAALGLGAISILTSLGVGVDCLTDSQMARSMACIEPDTEDMSDIELVIVVSGRLALTLEEWDRDRLMQPESCPRPAE